jgi:hypothetical protein
LKNPKVPEGTHPQEAVNPVQKVEKNNKYKNPLEVFIPGDFYPTAIYQKSSASLFQ